MTDMLFLDDIIEKTNQFRTLLLKQLQHKGIKKISLWGVGLTGEIIMNALIHGGIEVDAVYDSHQQGVWYGRKIINPFQNLKENVPIIVASSRHPKNLTQVIDYLQAKKIQYYLPYETEGNRLKAHDFMGIQQKKRCFVLGNGPSLNAIDMTRLSNEITFGSNRCYLGFEKWGWSVNYWAIEDSLVAEDVAVEWNQLSGPVKFIPKDLIHLVTNFEHTVFLDFKRLPFQDMPRFSGCFCELYWGGTVTYLLLQLAVIMGCDPIYLIGVDHNYQKPLHITYGRNEKEWISHGDDPNHFHPDYFGNERQWHDPQVNRMTKAYQSAYEYCRQKSITLLNATPNSRLEVIPRVDYNSLF